MAYSEGLASILIGLVGGLVTDYGWQWEKWQLIDDPVGAFAVHGASGAWGLLAVGIFHKDRGLIYGHGELLGVQVVCILAVTVWTTIAAGMFFLLLHMVFGLRVSEVEEMLGLDRTLGGSAYPDWFLLQEHMSLLTSLEEFMDDPEKRTEFMTFLSASTKDGKWMKFVDFMQEVQFYKQKFNTFSDGDRGDIEAYARLIVSNFLQPQGKNYLIELAESGKWGPFQFAGGFDADMLLSERVPWNNNALSTGNSSPRVVRRFRVRKSSVTNVQLSVFDATIQLVSEILAPTFQRYIHQLQCDAEQGMPYATKPYLMDTSIANTRWGAQSHVMMNSALFGRKKTLRVQLELPSVDGTSPKSVTQTGRWSPPNGNGEGASSRTIGNARV